MNGPKTPSVAAAGLLWLLLATSEFVSAANALQQGAGVEAPATVTASVAGSTVTFNWLPPASGNAPSSYVLEAGTAPGQADVAQVDTASASTSLVVAGVPSGTYYVRIRSRSGATLSSPSNEVTVMVGPVGCAQVPPAPVSLTPLISGSTVTLSWQLPIGGCPASSFSVHVGSSSGTSNLGVFPSATNQLSATAVAAGTYFVRVRSLNAAGTSAASNEAIVVVGGSSAPVDTTCMRTPNPIAPGGFLSEVSNVDAFGGLQFITFLDPLPHGCRVVNTADGHPARDGSQSLRFELHANDCNSSPASPDCQTGRSRYEIFDHNRGLSSDGRVITYELWVYVPVQPPLRPRGGNIMFLNQLQYLPPTAEASAVPGVLAYLEVGENYELLVRTHTGFSFEILNRHLVLPNPVGTWNKIVWEIGGTTQSNGFLRVYVNDVLKVDETRPTLPLPGWRHSLKIGMYNAFRPQSTEPFGTQVVYFDGIRRSIR
jgi:hypothetical protein